MTAIRLGFLLLMSGAASLWAGPPFTMHLWPKSPPGQAATAQAERNTTTPQDAKVAGKLVIRLGNVSDPSMTVYRPPADNAKGTAILVFPGGGYRILAMDLEGTEVCQWLASIGITAVL